MKYFPGIILLCYLLCTSPVQAAHPDIYIHNRLLQGEVIKEGEEFFVQAEELKKLVKTSFSRDDSTGNIIIDGEISTIKFKRSENKIFVPLIAITRIMGYDVLHNKATGILDIFIKKQHEPEQAPQEPVSSSSYKSGEQEIHSETDPLTVIEKSITHSTAAEIVSADIPIRITAEVINGRFTRARNVKVRCVLKRADGTIYDRQEVYVGDLEPGMEKEVLFYFNLSSHVLKISPKYEIISD